MTKARILDGEDPIPPMPGAKEKEAGGPSSPSIGLGSEEKGPDVVDEGLAGDLIGLPFEAWANFENRVPKEVIVLTEKQKEYLAGPVSRVLTKYGLGKIAKDEVIIVAVLSAHTFSVVSALRKAKKVDEPVPAEAE